MPRMRDHSIFNSLQYFLFQVIMQTHLKVCQLAFTVNIHMSTKTCVTGNNLVLHKALTKPRIDITERVSFP